MRGVKPERIELYEYSKLLLIPRDRETEKLIKDLMGELKRCGGDRYELVKKGGVLASPAYYFLRDRRLRIYRFSCGFMLALLDADGRVNPNDIVYLRGASIRDVSEHVLRIMVDALGSMNCSTAVKLAESLLKDYKELKVTILAEKSGGDG